MPDRIDIISYLWQLLPVVVDERKVNDLATSITKRKCNVVYVNNLKIFCKKYYIIIIIDYHHYTEVSSLRVKIGLPSKFYAKHTYINALQDDVITP